MQKICTYLVDNNPVSMSGLYPHPSLLVSNTNMLETQNPRIHICVNGYSLSLSVVVFYHFHFILHHRGKS